MERHASQEGPEGVGLSGAARAARAGRERRACPLLSFFLPHLGYGGVEQVTLSLASALMKRGCEVDLLVARHAGGLSGRVEEGIEIVDLDVRRVAAALPGLCRYLRQRRPQAIISCKTHASVIATLSTLLSGSRTRHVIWEHSKHQFEDPKTLLDRVVLGLATFLYRRADRIVAVSTDVAGHVAEATGVPVSEIHVIPNPAVTGDTPRRLEDPLHHPWLSNGGRTIVAVGRLVKEKDFSNLLKAMRRVREEVDARLLILGEGEERDELERLAESLDLEGSVGLPGFVANPLPYLSRSGIFALSSRSEGFPVALVEAMFAGCEVVATRCSAAVEEILDRGKYGRLVPVGDPEALGRALLEALRAPRRVRILRERAKLYSADRVAAMFERTILEERDPQSGTGTPARTRSAVQQAGAETGGR